MTKVKKKDLTTTTSTSFDHEKFKKDYNQMIDEKKEIYRLSEILDTNDNMRAMAKAYERPK
jgi:hypothetical protein